MKAQDRWMESTGDSRWQDALKRITNEYNDTPHSTLKGFTPNDAETDEYLQSELRVQNALKMYNNTLLRRHRVKVGDRFRAPLKRGKMSRGFTPRFSGHVYTVEKIVPGGFVESERLLFKKKDILLVPQGSRDIP